MKPFSFPALGSILSVERVLQNVLGPHIYVGGACVGFYIDDPGAAEIRPTDDVDVVVEIATEVDRVRLDAALRNAGLTNDLDGLICRWLFNGLKVDIMPTDGKLLGFSNQWYREALDGADCHVLEDLTVCIPNVVTFLATKIDAFIDRGKNDFAASSDFEDIVRVLDGCSRISEEADKCPTHVRTYVRSTFQTWTETRDFADAVAAHLFDDGGAKRLELVADRMKKF